MAKGQKRPPQESIDSILLAMSRRDDIDSTTLSHYFDRLDEEWTSGAREKVLHLLRVNDAAAHSAAILILSELATDFDLEELEDLVADPTVSDLAKLTLAPVLKELGSEMADDGIIDYLNDPEAAMLQMQIRLLELIGQSELGIESVLEDVLGMPMDRRLGFINWLGMSQDPRAAKLLLPLLENQSSKVVLAVIEALEQLGPVVARESIPALNYLLSNTSNRQVKQQARAALGRLTMQSAPGTEDDAMDLAVQEQQLPLYEARVSYIDGVGAQMIMLAWQRADGLLKGVNVLFQDEWGIKDCYGTDDMEIDHWKELVTGMEDQGFSSFTVPLAYCRALIAEARTINKRTRHKIPVAYAVWRPSIEGDAAAQKQPVPTVIEARPYSPAVETLAQRGEMLFSLAEFSSWYFEPFDSIRQFVVPYMNSQARAEKPVRSRKRKISKPDATQADLETIVTDVLTQHVDSHWRLLHETRLRRQAALLNLIDRTADAQLVVAVASMLHPDSGVASPDQPYLRALVHRSLQGGLVRLMSEALDSGPFGRSPFTAPPDDDVWGW